MSNRETEARIASKLESVLGEDYLIRYDAYDSGMTWFFYRGEFYKRVENSVLNGSINAYDFAAPVELRQI